MILLLLSTAVAATTAAAAVADSPPLLDRIPLSGRIFSDVYVPTEQTTQSKLNEASASFFLQIDPKLSDSVTGRVVFEGRDLQASSTTTAPQFISTLREGYADYTHKAWELRVGKVIQPWGKSDVVNPTDYLSAKDYTQFNPDDEVRRLGNLETDLTWSPSPWTFDLRWAPVASQSTLLVPPSALPAGVTIQSNPLAPTANLSNSELALRAGYAGDGWDFSLSAYRGLTKIPEFEVVSVSGTLPNLNIAAAKAFQRVRSLGGDFSWSPGAQSSWVFRGEGSFSWTDNSDGADPALEPSHFDSVIGAERPLGGDFRMQAQFLWRYHPNLRPPSSVSDPVQQELAQANSQLLGYQYRSRPGATFRIAYDNQASGFMSEIFLIGNFVGGDYLVRPKLSYAWTDAFRTTLGSDYYGGPTNRTLGALHVYNSLFAEAKLTF